MSSQPVSGDQSKRVNGTEAGTVIITDRNARFTRVILGSNKTGTATFYDSATAGGSASTNYIVAIDNTSGTVPRSVEIGVRVKNGLIAVVGGTTEMTVVWD